MLNKLKKSKLDRSSKGFTIIEVMIVLAIAGLIMLIVFLAVPALQRSSRNTQRKNDVSAITASVANYISNNNGAVPDTISISGSTVTVKCANNGANGSVCDKTDTNTETATVGLITAVATDSTAKVGDTATSAEGTANTAEAVYAPGFACNSSGTALGSKSPRSASVLYVTENGGTPSNECLEQ